MHLNWFIYYKNSLQSRESFVSQYTELLKRVNFTVCIYEPFLENSLTENLCATFLLAIPEFSSKQSEQQQKNKIEEKEIKIKKGPTCKNRTVGFIYFM